MGLELIPKAVSRETWQPLMISPFLNIFLTSEFLSAMVLWRVLLGSAGSMGFRK